MNYTEKITDREQAEDFLRFVYKDLKLNAHPDDSFTEYVDADNNAIFSAEDAQVLDERMTEAFEILDEEIYDITMMFAEEYLFNAENADSVAHNMYVKKVMNEHRASMN